MMIKLTTGNLKSGYILLLALSVAAPNYLVAQQAIAPTSIQLNEEPSATKPVYDVATIKRGNWGVNGGALLTELKFSDDSFIAKEMDLHSLVCAAYGVEGYQVSGGPDWVRDGNDGYDVTAKTTEESTIETLHKMEPKQAKLVQEQMLQALLADRFKLTVHRDTKQLPMSVLVVSKGGLKIQPTKQATTSPDAPQGADNPPKASMNFENAADGLLITATDYSMDSVAGWLAGELRHPVKNMTGLNGSYDFKLHYSPENFVSEASASGFTAPSITTAIQEQLGLKLELRKGPMEIIIIDHVERPSAN
jgi:uncharacterized protein (TIGR03435 family)